MKMAGQAEWPRLGESMHESRPFGSSRLKRKLALVGIGAEREENLKLINSRLLGPKSCDTTKAGWLKKSIGVKARETV